MCVITQMKQKLFPCLNGKMQGSKTSCFNSAAKEKNYLACWLELSSPETSLMLKYYSWNAQVSVNTFSLKEPHFFNMEMHTWATSCKMHHVYMIRVSLTHRDVMSVVTMTESVQELSWRGMGGMECPSREEVMHGKRVCEVPLHLRVWTNCIEEGKGWGITSGIYPWY